MHSFSRLSGMCLELHRNGVHHRNVERPNCWGHLQILIRDRNESGYIKRRRHRSLKLFSVYMSRSSTWWPTRMIMRLLPFTALILWIRQWPNLQCFVRIASVMSMTHFMIPGHRRFWKIRRILSTLYRIDGVFVPGGEPSNVSQALLSLGKTYPKKVNHEREWSFLLTILSVKNPNQLMIWNISVC